MNKKLILAMVASTALTVFSAQCVDITVTTKTMIGTVLQGEKFSKASHTTIKDNPTYEKATKLKIRISDANDLEELKNLKEILKQMPTLKVVALVGCKADLQEVQNFKTDITDLKKVELTVRLTKTDPKITLVKGSSSKGTAKKSNTFKVSMKQKSKIFELYSSLKDLQTVLKAEDSGKLIAKNATLIKIKIIQDDELTDEVITELIQLMPKLKKIGLRVKGKKSAKEWETDIPLLILKLQKKIKVNVK